MISINSVKSMHSMAEYNPQNEIPSEEDDSRKVYVSRLPLEWAEEHLAEHFSACFGPVESASVKWDKTNECSKGYGFVTFVNESDKVAAVKQGSLHAKRRNIQIKAVSREASALGRGRDDGICYMWQKYSCVKGDTCRFSHNGEGGCVKVSEPYTTVRKCLSFKSKGRCSKGEACPFLHDTSNSAESKRKAPEKAGIKICHAFKKKGKCRKGDACIFFHDLLGSTAKPAVSNKRRIDGSFLVEARKKAKKQDGGIM